MTPAFQSRHAIEQLVSLLGPGPTATVVDVGASPVEANPPYAGLLDRRLCTLTGFEPLDEPRRALEERKSDLETYLPDIVADGRDHTLHMTILPSMTSLLEPDRNTLASFPHVHVWGYVKEQRRVKTIRLDDLEMLPTIDFLKVDAQGSELMVLRGGARKLARCVVVHVEVAFVPLYREQPSLGDIDLELRARGLVPHMICDVRKRLVSPMRDTADPFAGFNQVLKADLVYVRDFTRPDEMSDDQLRHLAVISLICYGSIDLTANCLMRLSERGVIAADAVPAFMRSLLRGDDASAA